jgi:hypothetical protein
VLNRGSDSAVQRYRTPVDADFHSKMVGGATTIRIVELTRLSVEGEKRKIAIATLYRLNSNSEYTDRFRLFGERSNTSPEKALITIRHDQMDPHHIITNRHDATA